MILRLDFTAGNQPYVSIRNFKTVRVRPVPPKSSKVIVGYRGAGGEHVIDELRGRAKIAEITEVSIIGRRESSNWDREKKGGDLTARNKNGWSTNGRATHK